VGYLDDRVDDLQQGLDDLAAGDELAQTNALLAIVAAELTDRPTSYYQDGFEPTAPGESDDARQTAQYTSRESITATDSPDTQNWGFEADTIVIRNITDELAVAFKDPAQSEDATITVTTDDDPFVLSGVYGIRTAKMWYQQGNGAAGPADFDLLAVKRRGGAP
jgi:hypothetical protein